MLPDRVSNPGPLTYESGALPIALPGPAKCHMEASVSSERKKNTTALGRMTKLATPICCKHL